MRWCSYHDKAWNDRLHECMYEICDKHEIKVPDNDMRVEFEDGTSCAPDDPQLQVLYADIERKSDELTASQKIFTEDKTLALKPVSTIEEVKEVVVEDLETEESKKIKIKEKEKKKT